MKLHVFNFSLIVLNRNAVVGLNITFVRFL